MQIFFYYLSVVSKPRKKKRLGLDLGNIETVEQSYVMPPTFMFKSIVIASLDALKWRDLLKDDTVQNGTRLRWKVRAFLSDLVVTVTVQVTHR